MSGRRGKSIAEDLRRQTAGDFLSLATPGHRLGRGLAAVGLEELVAAGRLDISPPDEGRRWQEGDFAAAERKLAGLCRAGRSFFLYNGSTVGILAMQMLFGEGDAVAVPRHCHQSVIHGFVLSGARPEFAWPRLAGDWLATAAVDAAEWRRVAGQPDVRAIFCLSPSYYGVGENWSGLTEIIRQSGQLLLCDRAHGAHLGLASDIDGFDRTAVSAWVESAHKTLPVLTQGSWLHCAGQRLDIDRLAGNLRILQSTSPNYLLITSLASAVDYLGRRGKELYRRMAGNAEYLRRLLHNNNQIEILSERHLPAGHVVDPARLVAGIRAGRLSGRQVEAELLANCNIQAEMADDQSLVLIVSGWESKGDLRRVARGLAAVTGGLAPAASSASPARPALASIIKARPGRPDITPRQAWQARRRLVPWRQAVGLIAVSTLTVYPPGLALVVTGERCDDVVLQAIAEASEAGLQIRGWADRQPGMIAVVA